jgi:hypothetical protein
MERPGQERPARRLSGRESFGGSCTAFEDRCSAPFRVSEIPCQAIPDRRYPFVSILTIAQTAEYRRNPTTSTCIRVHPDNKTTKFAPGGEMTKWSSYCTDQERKAASRACAAARAEKNAGPGAYRDI